LFGTTSGWSFTSSLDVSMTDSSTSINNTISDTLPSAILLHTDKSWHQNSGCSFAFWSNIPFLVPQYLGPSNPWCKHQCHLCTTIVQQHSQTQTEDIMTRFAQPHVYTYIHVLSLCHLYSFTSYLKNHKWELPKDTFLVHSSHNFTPKRNEFIRYHCCLSQLYFIGHYLPVAAER
jgi:hypothetical protein